MAYLSGASTGGRPMQTFNEKQISAILRRAAELQTDAPTTESGLTLDELQHVAAEAGIAPEFVARAAREVQGGAASARERGFAFWGAPVTIHEERVLGHVLDEDEWGALVQEAQRIYGQSGTVSGVGQTRSWSYGNRSHNTGGLTVTTRRGRTIVTVHRNLTQEIGATFGPGSSIGIVSAMLVAMEAMVGMPLAFRIAAAVALLFAVYLGARAVVATMARVQRRKLAAVLDAAETLAGETEARRAEPAQNTASDPISPLELGVDEAEPPTAAPVPRRARTR